MPYETKQEEICLDCCETSCIHNEDKECTCDEDVNDLCENDRHVCSEYSLRFINGEFLTFKNFKDLDSLVQDHEDFAPLIVYDKTALNILFVTVPCQEKKHAHRAFVQMSAADTDTVLFKPSIDGSVLIVPKAQTELCF
jgi:hypothetical protein